MREDFGAGRATMLGLLAELDATSDAAISDLVSRCGAHLVEPAMGLLHERVTVSVRPPGWRLGS